MRTFSIFITYGFLIFSSISNANSLELNSLPIESVTDEGDESVQ